MSIVKVIELIGESSKSWEDATQSAVKHANRSVRNLRSVYVEGLQAIVEDDEIKKYRCNVKISFIVD